MAYKTPKKFKPVQKAAKSVLKKCPRGVISLRTRGLTKGCKAALRTLKKAQSAYYRASK